MNKIVIASDSFKGTISSTRLCELVKTTVKETAPSYSVISIPVADGGEGTVDSVAAATGAKKKSVNVLGPNGKTVKAEYAVLDHTAIIEMAAEAGLPLMEGKLNPLSASTFGVGQAINDAIKNGCDNIILGLGGSATTDCGCGMASALGTKFFNEENQEFVPTGETLKNIFKIDNNACEEKLKGISITAMCDVTNPLYGPQGAAYVYGPQKGADSSTVKLLDEGLKHIARIIKKELKTDVSDLEGGGAAGGMGAGCKAFLGAELKPGSKAILDACGFDEKIKEASFIISGEGRIDEQSLQGKLLSQLSFRAKRSGVKLVIIAGCEKNKARKMFEENGISVFLTADSLPPFDGTRETAEKSYIATLKKVLDIYCK